MIELEFSLITGRSIEQGCGKEQGKLSEEYVNNVALCEMNVKDMEKLNIRDGGNVKVTTKFGSVVLKAKKSRRIKSSGIIFIPYGAWANVVLGPDTEGTGMPLLKGLKATVESTNEKVLGLPDLIIQVYGKEKS
ncbi:MAG: molybdopterin dinucleotide binding domain-containing protein [Candidatus Bathyarchaeia archaeon]